MGKRRRRDNGLRHRGRCVAVASALMGLTTRIVTISLPGGRLLINWSEKDNHVYMTGDAVKVLRE